MTRKVQDCEKRKKSVQYVDILSFLLFNTKHYEKIIRLSATKKQQELMVVVDVIREKYDVEMIILEEKNRLTI